MAKNEGFKPAEGVTVENSLRYIVAVEEAAMNEFRSLEPNARAIALVAIRTSLVVALNTIDKLIELDELERDEVINKKMNDMRNVN